MKKPKLMFQQGPNLTRKNHGSGGKRSDQQYCCADVVYYINIAISFYLNCNDYLVEFKKMAAWLAALCRLLTTLLVISLFFNYMFQDSLKLESDRLGVGFSEFMVVSTTPSTPFDKQVLRRSGKTDAIGIPLSRKLALGVRLVNMALITNLFLLANDVAINPGPTQTSAHFWSCDSSFSSCFSN